MEFKVIVYIIIAVVYFIYSAMKKAQENGNASPEKQLNKPVSPPSANPLEDILREIQKRKAVVETQKNVSTVPAQPKKSQFTQAKKQPKDLLIHQIEKGVFAEGNYERELTEEEKIYRGELKIENEGIYKIKSMDEQEEEDANTAFQFNARNAIIGSIVLERRY